MNVPFTKSDFLDVFARYNQATPAIAFVLVVMVRERERAGSRFLWLRHKAR